MIVFLCVAGSGRGAQAFLLHSARAPKSSRMRGSLQWQEERGRESRRRRGEALALPVPAPPAASGIQSAGEDEVVSVCHVRNLVTYLILSYLLCCIVQDCLVYLLNREQHTVGQETPSARPNICLFSPDILPLHCRLRRVPALRRHVNNKGEELAESQRFCIAVEPVLHATVLVNFSRCERSTTLRHGDLLSFGSHYIFLYKDPTGAKPLPAQTLARLRSLGQLYDAGLEEGEGGAQTCKMCGSVLKDRAVHVSSVSAVRRSFRPHLVKPRGGRTAPGGPVSLSGGESGGGGRGGGGQRRRLHLEFDQAHEDQLLNRIISLIEPGGLCSDFNIMDNISCRK